jgi:hypothetical protein
MDLTKIERQTLINQYEILKLLTDNDGDVEHYEELIQILHDGYSIFYDDAVHVYDGMSKEDCKFVLDVLDMYRAIEDYKHKSPKDDEVQNHVWGIFHGFDGNNETPMLGFTRFLIEKQGKFTEQIPYKDKVDSWNSHAQLVETYERMMAKWKANKNQHGLTRDEVLGLLAEAKR